MKHFIALGFLGVLFPIAVFAQTTTQSAQIQALLAQIQYLQSLLGAIEGAGTSQGLSPVVPVLNTSMDTALCSSFTRDLRLGSEGADVTALQTLLAKDRTLYPEARITGYYGALTARAVERFQIAQGVASGGTPSTTGFGAVGPKTRAALNALCSGKVLNSAVAEDLNVSPRIGQVPLTVVATFSLNGSSCSSFILDWGDGTPPITFDAGYGTACTKDIAHKEAKHTYRTAGAYSLILKTTQGPLTSVTEVARVPVYVGVPVPASFSLSPTSGRAPLTTSVTFPVTGSTCTSFELDWGDGTIDRHERTSAQCSADAGTEARSHVYSAPGSYNVTLKTGQASIAQLSVNERWTVSVGEPVGGAALSFLNTSGPAPFTVNLGLTAGEGVCASYVVDWGDGTAIQQFDANTSSACTAGSRVFTHTYIAPGTYSVKTKVGTGALSLLSFNTQPIVVTTPTVQTTQSSCADARPVCGELGSGACQSGYVCTPIRKNYPTVCAMQADGAYMVNYGTCQ